MENEAKKIMYGGIEYRVEEVLEGGLIVKGHGYYKVPRTRFIIFPRPYKKGIVRIIEESATDIGSTGEDEILVGKQYNELVYGILSSNHAIGFIASELPILTPSAIKHLNELKKKIYIYSAEALNILRNGDLIFVTYGFSGNHAEIYKRVASHEVTMDALRDG